MCLTSMWRRDVILIHLLFKKYYQRISTHLPFSLKTTHMLYVDGSPVLPYDSFCLLIC